MTLPSTHTHLSQPPFLSPSPSTPLAGHILNACHVTCTESTVPECVLLSETGLLTVGTLVSVRPVWGRQGCTTSPHISFTFTGKGGGGRVRGCRRKGVNEGEPQGVCAAFSSLGAVPAVVSHLHEYLHLLNEAYRPECRYYIKYKCSILTMEWTVPRLCNSGV